MLAWLGERMTDEGHGGHKHDGGDGLLAGQRWYHARRRSPYIIPVGAMRGDGDI